MELFAPGNIEPFPFQPLYTERYLWDLGEEIFGSPDTPLARLVNSVGVATFENKVEVGTEHVAKVKRLVVERFGAEAPFLVVWMAGGSFL